MHWVFLCKPDYEKYQTTRYDEKAKKLNFDDDEIYVMMYALFVNTVQEPVHSFYEEVTFDQNLLVFDGMLLHSAISCYFPSSLVFNSLLLSFSFRGVHLLTVLGYLPTATGNQ